MAERIGQGDRPDITARPADDVRNITFNPSLGYFSETALDRLCRSASADGFELVRVVPHTQYEAVAVFKREVRTDDE